MTTLLNRAQTKWRRAEPAIKKFEAGLEAEFETIFSPKEKTLTTGPLFNNPFKLEDLSVFDGETLREIIEKEAFGVKISDLALSLQGVEGPLVDKIRPVLKGRKLAQFQRETQRAAPRPEVEAARRKVLDGLFWELTYWKTPELYEELTEGERLHPGIFRQIGPDLQGKTVLDAGAGSGRATFESLKQGARQVYAVEPSPGLLNILENKLDSQPAGSRIVPLRGRFDAIPLEDKSVDVAVSCSAFTADPEQGGEPGLAELRRVTKPGGKIFIIWPRREDHAWLQAHDFRYVALPLDGEMKVRFRSLASAVRCARRFYARNGAVLNYLRSRRRAEVPFSVLGFNPPHDYCYLKV